jgi:DNA-binding MarR family transcriptional regulator
MVAEVRKRAARMSHEQGATMLQVQAIQILRDRGNLNISELALALHLNQSTVSGLADRLESARLVRRVADSSDRRRVKLMLTDKAFELAGAVPVSPMDMFRQILGPLTDDELRQILPLFGKVEDAFHRGMEAIDRVRAAARAG